MQQERKGRGLFITFEGSDGSGKSTQIGLLKEYLESLGMDVILTREPGGTDISEKIRSIILDPENTEMGHVTEMLLYGAARAQLVEQVICPALQAGKTVICDRFLDSSVAYQGFGRNLGDAVQTVNAPAVAGCMPDLTFYMRLEPEAGIRRISQNKLDRIESEKADFRSRVYEGYEYIMRKEPGRVIPVDASLSIEEISEFIKIKINAFDGI